MASFRLGPLKSPNRRLLSHQNTPPFSIDPSQLQVSLEQTQGAPPTPQANRQSSGKSSPLRGRCVKEYEEQLQQLQHENFNLKLRVFLLEERVGKALGRTDAADIIKNNIELKVENETLKKSLAEKCQLLAQASGAIEELENQQRASLASHQAEQRSLQQQLQHLQKELAEAEEARVNGRMSLMPDESNDLYAQAFGSFLLNPNQPTCNYSDHHSKKEMDELQAKVDQLVSEATARVEEMDKLSSEVSQSQGQLKEFQQRVQALENDITQMENNRVEKDLKIANLTSLLDNQTRESKIRHPAVEKDKIIEEKQHQLEQQNKILVEIQITLDEKQKQIAELEGSLNDKKKKVVELEKSLSKAGRTLQGFVTDIQKKEKELEHLKVEGRKKDKRVKDLTAELKEAQELFNKTKWETEVSGKEDNIKAMAEEENERLWAELEEKKKLLIAAEQQKARLQLDADQLASLRLEVGQKEQAVAEAETQIATLKRQMMDLQQEMNSRAAIPSSHRSELRSRHSLDSTEQQQQQPTALAAQLAAYVRERQDLTETVQSLKNQLLAYQNGNGEPTEAASWKLRYEESQEKAERMDKELQRLKAEIRSWKKQAETSFNGSMRAGDHEVRSYKKELTALRQRLADSTNACDLLRTRLEEMADFLEEILSMSQQELLNLSNWSAASKRRQALQHSILQSRELSRTLSQSLMIGVDPDDQQQHSSSSLSTTSSNWSSHSNEQQLKMSREKSVDSLPPPCLDTEEIGCQVQLELSAANEPSRKMLVDQLRETVKELQDQVKQRDEEIARMKITNNTVANNKSMQTDRLSLATQPQNKNLLISSTPYHRPGQTGATFLSPVAMTRGKTQPTAFSGELFPPEPTDSINFSAKESISPPKAPLQPRDVGMSESEAWSEPDRTVSFARIGLPVQHQIEINSIAALLSNKKPIAHSNAGLLTTVDSSDSSKRTARRSRSDPCEVKRTGNRLRSLEQENSKLRLQLAELVNCLRSTYDIQFSKDESVLLEDSQDKEESINASERRNSIDDLAGAGDLTTAQYIIDALKNRLLKMKEVIKRRESRLREAKDLNTQLEFKVREKYYRECEIQLQLKEVQERLGDKNREVELLEARWIEAQSQWMSTTAAKDRQAAELRSALDARETELRTALMKAQLWETSYNDGQKTMRQVESELKSQQERLIQSMSLLEQQVRVLKEDLESVREDRSRLQKELEMFREQAANAELSQNSPILHAALQSTSRRRSSQGIQRQASQMSDYVSDQAVSEDQAPNLVIQAGKNNESNASANASRPSALHLSPDLGIDSDPGRFSSLEHSAVEHKDAHGFNSWATNKVSPKQKEAVLHKDGLSPDVLNSSSCVNCNRWENKYIKAKQTLAATLEKLQAANVRKEKVDRALNKELGKTHNILCQARGLLEQANHAGN